MPGGNGTEAELPKTLQAATTAVAADVMENLEKLQAAVNGGLGLVNFEAPIEGVVEASGDLNELTDSYVDVPGSERTVKPTTAATLIVEAQFELKAFNTSSPFEISDLFGVIDVDGEIVGLRARLAYDAASGTESTFATVSAKAEVALEAGEHAVKLRAKRSESGDRGICFAAGTGYSYRVIAR